MAQYTFISYTHENSRFANKLARDLHRQGIPVWLDQWHLSQEEAWDKAIGRALDNCRYFLLILSPAALNSWLVREQYSLAAYSGKKIVLVMRRPCQLPADLNEISPIDFTGPDYRASFIHLSSQLSEPGTTPLLEVKSSWANIAWGRITSFTSQFESNWLTLLALFAFVAVTSLLLWPEVDAATFIATPPAERLPVVSPDLQPEPLLAATPILTKVRARDGKVMVLVRAGEFWMGSAEADPLAEDNEKPGHLVFLDVFWIDKQEVTNNQYQLCVAAGNCTPFRTQGRRFEGDFQPVVGVDWYQARAYCHWAGGRLPTEAEWEKAARGSDGRIYPWGNEFDGSRLNFCDTNCIADWRDFDSDDGYPYTAPVGSFPSGASPYGVLDMSGNVWEWTADWYAADYYHYSTYENPTGPVSGQQRVVRGGSWYYYGKNLRTAARHRDIPTYRYDNIGFRCVMEK